MAMARLGSNLLGCFRRKVGADEKLGSRWNNVCTRDRYNKSSSKIDSAATTGRAHSVFFGGGGEGQARRGRDVSEAVFSVLGGDTYRALFDFLTGSLTGAGTGSGC